VIIKFCLVFPKIFLSHKVVRDAKKVEKHWVKVPYISWVYDCTYLCKMSLQMALMHIFLVSA